MYQKVVFVQAPHQWSTQAIFSLLRAQVFGFVCYQCYHSGNAEISMRYATMANLIVRNVDDEIANALKMRASRHGISAEAEHRRILEQALKRPKKRSFLEVLSQIPEVGTDEDFARVQDQQAPNPFD
jgi:plasmid stability protein